MRIAPSLTIASLLALAACGSTAANDSVDAGNAATANVADPAANQAKPDEATNSATATPAAGAALTQEYIVGRWTDSGNCADAIEFRADGAMVGPFGQDARWELRGSDLYMVGNPDPLRMTVVDQRTMEMVRPSGDRRRATRC